MTRSLERESISAAAIARPAPPSVDVDAVVDAFWAHHSRHRTPLRRSVARLGELALSNDRSTAARGTQVLFERIIEPLSDGFTPLGAETYRRVFAQIVCAARRLRRCEPLDAVLREDGVKFERQLLQPPAPAILSRDERSRIEAVLVLSRLTLGADIAIAVPVLQRMKALFPRAQVVFVGTQSAGVVARTCPDVEHIAVPYGRTAFLADRLNAWPVLRRAVDDACSGIDPERWLLVDPDSRLTQLGLLPPAAAARTFHFPSRSYGANGTESLGVLVRRWLDETFGSSSSPARPLRVDHDAAQWAKSLRSRCLGARPWVAVSFGVGGNARKRAGLAFEAALLEWLVRYGYRVLLARGAGPDEVEECYRLSQQLAARRISVCHLPTGRSLDGLDGADPDVITWEADIDAFFAAIQCADAYVGYDSAGQHIAAALGVPTLTLFIECAGRRHGLRWTPRGAGPVHVVRSPSPPEPAKLLAHAQAAFAALAADRPAEHGECR